MSSDLDIQDWDPQVANSEALARGTARSLERSAEGRGLRVKSRVVELRLAKGWRQLDLCTYSGLGQLAVQKAERGEIGKTRTDSLMRIANALGVGVADLFPILGSIKRD